MIIIAMADDWWMVFYARSVAKRHKSSDSPNADDDYNDNDSTNDTYVHNMVTMPRAVRTNGLYPPSVFKTHKQSNRHHPKDGANKKDDNKRYVSNTLCVQ